VDAPAALHWGLGRLPLERDIQEAPLLAFVEQLAHWNDAYNLTSVRAPVDMVVRHVLDSLVVLPYVKGRVLDVGSGGGLPGVPLAIADPSLHVTLLDSNGKKARFLRHVQRQMQLANVEVVEQRLEKYIPPVPFDTVICRAYSALGEFFEAALHLCAPKGRLLAMKGRIDEAELKAVPSTIRVIEIRGLHVPGLHEARHVVIAEPAAA
jgi:16S rRNA (guanine527-N7)-methyltransferase